jgi:hypothetical protein
MSNKASTLNAIKILDQGPGTADNDVVLVLSWGRGHVCQTVALWLSIALWSRRRKWHDSLRDCEMH